MMLIKQGLMLKNNIKFCSNFGMHAFLCIVFSQTKESRDQDHWANLIFSI